MYFGRKHPQSAAPETKTKTKTMTKTTTFFEIFSIWHKKGQWWSESLMFAGLPVCATYVFVFVLSLSLCDCHRHCVIVIVIV